MSGHSKWSSIKHKKGAADAKRGQLFTKLSKAIIVAAKEGGPDPASNLSLQNAIEKARSYSMPKDNIDRAIARGAGTDADAASYETVLYEGYGPDGVAVLVVGGRGTRHEFLLTSPDRQLVEPPGAAACSLAVASRSMKNVYDRVIWRTSLVSASASIAGSTKNDTGISTRSPGCSVCSSKQKQCTLAK